MMEKVLQGIQASRLNQISGINEGAPSPLPVTVKSDAGGISVTVRQDPKFGSEDPATRTISRATDGMVTVRDQHKDGFSQQQLSPAGVIEGTHGGNRVGDATLSFTADQLRSYSDRVIQAARAALVHTPRVSP